MCTYTFACTLGIISPQVKVSRDSHSVHLHVSTSVIMFWSGSWSRWGKCSLYIKKPSGKHTGKWSYILLQITRYMPISSLHFHFFFKQVYTTGMYMIILLFFFHFSGAIFVYIRLQTILWWLFQNAEMLYGVVRPFQYHNLSDSGRLKYLHITAVATGIGLPLIPVLICHWVGGYGIAVDLSYNCLPRNMSSVVYSFFVPATICAIIGISMLIYIASEFGIKV